MTNALLYEELNNYSEELKEKNIQLQTEVAERTLSEKALKESEEKYRLHFDNVMDVIYSVNSNLVITSISPSIEKLLGYKPEEVTSKPFPELNMLTSESLKRAYSDAKRILSGERIESAEYQFIAKDGSIKVGEVSSAPLFEDGKVIAIISVARDVTDRKQAQQELAESEERFRTMAENITNGLIILEQGKTVYVNERACEITGYSQEELMNMWGPDLTTLDETERKEGIINDIQKTGVWPEQIDTWMQRKDGSSCCVNLRFSFSSKAGQEYAGYVVVTDITEVSWLKKNSGRQLAF